MSELDQSRHYAEAVKWFRKAAEQGDAEAQNNLGAMYAKVRAFSGTTSAHRRGSIWQRWRAVKGRSITETLPHSICPAAIAEAQKLARETKTDKELPQ